jgi:MSHA biogenesis protein MshJ
VKRTWETLARRVDALSLRERVIGFVSALLVVVALLDALALSPRAGEQKALTQKLKSQNETLAGLRARSATAPAADAGPAAALQRELQALRAEREAVDAEIARRTPAAAAAPKLAALLESVLRRHERLSLRRLATGTPVATRPGLPPAQGVELAVVGSYPDLTQYVADLERSLPGLRWDELVVTRRDGAGAPAAELRARIALPGDAG